MPGLLTDITEIVTGLGTLAPDLPTALRSRPTELRNVSEQVWDRLVLSARSGEHRQAFQTAFANGAALLTAVDGLRGRTPLLVEWKGPHRPPGDDSIPADLRLDHVYLVSCKYLSKVLMNTSPARLFDRLLAGDERASDSWFALSAPREFQQFYETARDWSRMEDLPSEPRALSRDQQRSLRGALANRELPSELQPLWSDLCLQVSRISADRWRAALASNRTRLPLFWRLLRITAATYYVLGTDRAASLRLRVMSAWDWNQAFELRDLVVFPRLVGQPEVGWHAVVRERSTQAERAVRGHVEIRWSHGRFVGSPEAKVYLDTPHTEVPGYELLR